MSNPLTVSKEYQNMWQRNGFSAKRSLSNAPHSSPLLLIWTHASCYYLLGGRIQVAVEAARRYDGRCQGQVPFHFLFTRRYSARLLTQPNHHRRRLHYLLLNLLAVFLQVTVEHRRPECGWMDGWMNTWSGKVIAMAMIHGFLSSDNALQIYLFTHCSFAETCSSQL